MHVVFLQFESEIAKNQNQTPLCSKTVYYILCSEFINIQTRLRINYKIKLKSPILFFSDHITRLYKQCFKWKDRRKREKFLKFVTDIHVGIFLLLSLTTKV